MLSKVRKYHKWLMSFIWMQFLLWSITGVYMVTMDIHYIHGETLAKNEETKIDLASVDYSVAELAVNYPEARQIKLTQSMGNLFYSFINGEEGKVTIDLKLELFSPLSMKPKLVKLRNITMR